MIYQEPLLAREKTGRAGKIRSGISTMKQLLSIFLLTCSCSAFGEWTEFSTKSNGDVFFFDNARVEKSGDEISVWTRVRYKTSVMAASSYQSLLLLNCSENSEAILQSTFFTDEHWSKPAMATNTNAKPKTYIQKNSATEKLVSILCEA